jgi:hypothetical protein
MLGSCTVREKAVHISQHRHITDDINAMVTTVWPEPD